LPFCSSLFRSLICLSCPSRRDAWLDAPNAAGEKGASGGVVDIFHAANNVAGMTAVSLQSLRSSADETIRHAGNSPMPTSGVDATGEVVAVIASPLLFPPPRLRRERALLPEFEAMMRKPYAGNLQEDLDAVRGEA
jgi:hypothetical protein